jgi:hypothetical protein
MWRNWGMDVTWHSQADIWTQTFWSTTYSSLQKKNSGDRAILSCELPQITYTHLGMNAGRPYLLHTCWLNNSCLTQAALSFRETTAWFGARARWQFAASDTGFLVPSRHNNLKSSSFRSLAHGSGFFPGGREKVDQPNLMALVTGRTWTTHWCVVDRGLSGQQSACTGVSVTWRGRDIHVVCRWSVSWVQKQGVESTLIREAG